MILEVIVPISAILGQPRLTQLRSVTNIQKRRHLGKMTNITISNFSKQAQISSSFRFLHLTLKN